MGNNCKNCKYCSSDGCWDVTWYTCDITAQRIEHPRLHGGTKRCPCYERKEVKKEKFRYPTVNELKKYEEEHV